MPLECFTRAPGQARGDKISGSSAVVAILAIVALLAGVSTTAPAYAEGAEQTWSAPTDVSNLTNGYLANTDQRVEPDGTTFAAWTLDDRDSETTIHELDVADRPAGGTWSKPLRVSADDDDAFGPRLAVDTAGYVTGVTWSAYKEDAAGNFQSGYAGAADFKSGMWSPEYSSSPADESSVLSGGVWPDGMGGELAAWSGSTGFELVERSTATAWQSPVLQPADIRLGQLVGNGSGELVDLWSTSNEWDTANVVASVRSKAGAWSDPQTLAAAGSDPSTPKVAMAPDGTAAAIWASTSGIQETVRPPGGTWQAVQTIGSGGSPQIAIDDKDGVSAIWGTSDGLSVMSAYKPANSSWGTPVEISNTGTSAYLGDSDIVAQPNGTALAVWLHRPADHTKGDYGSLAISVRAAHGTWSTPSDLAAAGTNVMTPALASDASGDTTVTWTAYNGKSTDLFASSLDTAPRATDKPFVAGTYFVDGQLTCQPGSWTGSPSLSYQWFSDSGSGTIGGDPIVGATGSTFTPNSSYLRDQVWCQVTATNGAGSTVASADEDIVRPTPFAPATTSVSGEVLANISVADVLGPGDTLAVTVQNDAAACRSVVLSARYPYGNGTSVEDAHAAFELAPGATNASTPVDIGAADEGDGDTVPPDAITISFFACGVDTTTAAELGDIHFTFERGYSFTPVAPVVPTNGIVKAKVAIEYGRDINNDIPVDLTNGESYPVDIRLATTAYYDNGPGVPQTPYEAEVGAAIVQPGQTAKVGFYDDAPGEAAQIAFFRASDLADPSKPGQTAGLTPLETVDVNTFEPGYVYDNLHPAQNATPVAPTPTSTVTLSPTPTPKATATLAPTPGGGLVTPTPVPQAEQKTVLPTAPTVVPTPAPSSEVAPPSLRIVAGVVSFQKLSVTPTKAGKCPKAAEVTVTAGKSREAKSLKVTPTKAGCQISGSIKLSGKLKKAKTVTVTISGKGLKATKRAVTSG